MRPRTSAAARASERVAGRKRQTEQHYGEHGHEQQHLAREAARLVPGGSHDALGYRGRILRERPALSVGGGDRKSTRLNSSHGYISYAVFCLKKKKEPRCTREAL